MKIVVFSGAGMSAESGVATFRDSGGLWENHRIEDVATPEAFARDPERVLEFYNVRRKQIAEVEPNQAHKLVKSLEDYGEVHVITQNIDDLHERAGSNNVLHLHGEIMKAQSSKDPDYVEKLEKLTIDIGDLCPKGGQLRPHVVWFGEAVPMMTPAIEITAKADVFIVIGTSLNVYPAASLVTAVSPNCQGFIIDPDENHVGASEQYRHIKANASEGMEIVYKSLQSSSNL